MQRRVGRLHALLVAFAVVAGALVGTAIALAQERMQSLPPFSEAEVLAMESGIYPIIFPVAGDHSYTDSWGARRSGGRTHQGTDIFADKGVPVVAAAAGIVTRVTIGERAGRYMIVEHAGGWQTLYLHLNNDTPGTDDGALNATPEGIEVGAKVEAGDVLDYVGDSGNAEGTPSHLHFEIHGADGVPVNPYPSLRAAEGRPLPIQVIAAEPLYRADNVAFAGHLDPGGGFAADVTAHGGVAYLSTWGRPQACPASGVRMIDVSDPYSPVQMGSIASGADFPNTSTDSVWVGAIDNEFFTGDLAVVAIRLCDTTEGGRREALIRGVALYEVTDPATPTLVGFFDTGEMTQGVHELDVVTRPDGSVLAAITVLQSWRHTAGAAGDLRIVDITDPAHSDEIADWDLRRDAPSEMVEELLPQVFDDLELHTHSATWAEDGTQLWLAVWDAGVTLLDTTDPGAPAHVTTFGFDPESEGNAHSVAVDVDAGLLIRNDQDLINADSERYSLGWGGQHLYDISDLESVVEVGTFRTERGVSNADGGALHVDGRYSAHNAQIVDGVEYVAWYSDGVRIIDVSDPSAPTEVASFIPPLSNDPQGYWDAPDGSPLFAMVWGVHVSGDYVYISDMNTGLWIVRYPPPPPKENRLRL